jgi:uncharacterized protein YbgA (DUF1722 family)
MDEKIKLGVSACLLGQVVRWNGGHARDRYLTDILGKYVEYMPVCPEVECGMGVPRETLRLVGDPDNPNLVTSKTNIDHTDRMNQWARKKVEELEKENLVDFHTRHKLLIMSHSPSHSQMMGKLVAGGKDLFIKDLFTQYETLLMEALRLKTTFKKNMNVLQHIMGYFKKQLSPDEKQELIEIIQQYRQEHVPLIVPVTLLNHYVRKYKQPYLAQQIYLNPHPIALKLRNHV